MKKIILATSLFILLQPVFSQEKKVTDIENLKGSTFFAELGGAGILFSANIDKRFKNSSFGWGGRIGLGFVSGYILPYNGNPGYYDNPASVVTIPLQLNYIFGKSGSSHTLEVGAGFTVVGKKIEVMDFYDDKANSFFGTASFMYRRQPTTGGFVWRVGFTPIISKGYIQPSMGASVGYSF